MQQYYRNIYIRSVRLYRIYPHSYVWCLEIGCIIYLYACILCLAVYCNFIFDVTAASRDERLKYNHHMAIAMLYQTVSREWREALRAIPTDSPMVNHHQQQPYPVIVCACLYIFILCMALKVYGATPMVSSVPTLILFLQ